MTLTFIFPKRLIEKMLNKMSMQSEALIAQIPEH